MKTKIALIFLGLGLSLGSTYAAHGDATPLPLSNDLNVTAPNQSGVWSFGLMAVLLQPVNKGYKYATEIRTTPDVDTPGSETDTPYMLNEGYSGWFGADITYAFPGNGRDVMLAYEGLHGSSTDSTSDNYNAEVSSAYPRDFLINNLTREEISDIKAKTDTSYDAGDLVFGQKINAGYRIQLHPFMGLRYARIDVQDSFNSTLASFPSLGALGGSEQGKLESSFNGIGPRLGSDANIALGQGFAIHGRLGVSVLIGTQKYNIDYVDTFLYAEDNPNSPPTVTEVQSQDRTPETHVIPEMDARLGLSYTHNCSAMMTLGIEAGWQVTDYFQALANPSDGLDEGTPTPVRTTNMDFGLQGPYARIQLDIA